MECVLRRAYEGEKQVNGGDLEGNMASGKEVFNEGSRNNQGEIKRYHDFLKGKIYAKLREGIGNTSKSICGTEARSCINKIIFTVHQ